MKVTKHEHACLDIELEGKRLLIDPGAFTTDLTDYSNVTDVVVTHIHADHFDPAKLRAIYAENPRVTIYTVQAVADELGDAIPITIVSGGYKTEAGLFTLAFYGEDHAVIHESLPRFKNIGVMVNQTLYYPGDSFTLPHEPVSILAAPASAPWLKISEAMDFITAVKPQAVFPTHNAILSDVGAGLYNRLLEEAATAVGAKYTALAPGQSLEV